MTFRDQLISELTQSDARQSKRSGYNPYALGIYLTAADECCRLIDSGMPQAYAFAEVFTPCRAMHTVARNLNLGLDVGRQNWILP